jgi:hypothetical protein
VSPYFRLQRIGALIEFVDNGLISPFANELPSEPSVFLQLFCNLGTPYVTDRLRPQPRGANGVSLAERPLDAFAEAAMANDSVSARTNANRLSMPPTTTPTPSA